MGRKVYLSDKNKVPIFLFDPQKFAYARLYQTGIEVGFDFNTRTYLQIDDEEIRQLVMGLLIKMTGDNVQEQE